MAAAVYSLGSRIVFFFQAEDGIRDLVRSRGLGDVYKRQIVMIALFLGIALVVGGERYRNIRVLIQELQELCLMIVGWIMRLAPLGTAALLLQLVASQQSGVLASLAHFIVVVIGTTLFHGLVVLPLILWLFTRISPIHFFKGAREALVTAFATSSSAATPVSYTHLRAHETVLDLVCRLLLEKKKTHL